jgi:hypothetical protein
MKRPAPILLLLMLWALPARAAIALDTSVNGGQVTGTSLTWSHTCTGSNLILFVSTVDGTGGSSNITGVTYAGVAMTKIGTGVQVSGDRWIELWYLIAPTTGANNVVVSANTSVYMHGISASYTGASQTGQPDASNAATGTGVTATVNVVTAADNCWTVTTAKSGGGSTISGGTNDTLRQSSGQIMQGDSNGPLSPAGTYTMTASISVTKAWAIISASFSPATGGAPRPSTLTLLGVGDD